MKVPIGQQPGVPRFLGARGRWGFPRDHRQLGPLLETPLLGLSLAPCFVPVAMATWLAAWHFQALPPPPGRLRSGWEAPHRPLMGAPGRAGAPCGVGRTSREGLPAAAPASQPVLAARLWFSPPGYLSPGLFLQPCWALCEPTASPCPPAPFSPSLLPGPSHSCAPASWFILRLLRRRVVASSAQLQGALEVPSMLREDRALEELVHRPLSSAPAGPDGRVWTGVPCPIAAPLEE